MMKFFGTLAALVLGFSASASFAADPVNIPGTRLAMVPPAGFTVAKEFAGLQGDKASILVIEFPAAMYDQLADAISSGAMAKQGVDITASEDLKGLPFKARAYRGKQVAKGTEFDKWLMLVDGGSTLSLINVSAAKDGAALTDAEVREMFGSVRLAAATASDPIEALPFSVTPAARFAQRQTIGGMGVVLMSAKPAPENAGKPVVIITKSFEQAVPKAQWPKAIETFLKSVKALKIDKMDEPKPVKVGDLEGLEVAATGTSDGEPRKILLTMLFGPKSGYALIAMAQPDLFDEAAGDFRSTVASFRLKP